LKKETSLFEKFKETGKHGIIFGVGSILHKLIAFVLLPVYTTQIEVSEYGALGLILTVGSVLSIIFIFGMNKAVFRSYFDYRNPEDRKVVISTGFILILFSSLSLIAIGFLSSNLLSSLIFDTARYRIHFIIVIATTAFEVLSIIPFVILRAEKKSIQFISFQTTFLIARLALIIYLILGRNWGILAVLVGDLTVGVLSCLTLYIYIKRSLILQFSKNESIKMLKLGLPLIPANISVYVFTAIDRYFINYYSTTSEVGLYNLAYKFGNLITVLFATPMALIWPTIFLSYKKDKNIKEFYTKALTYSCYIAFFLFLIFSLLSKELIHIMSDKEYWASYSVIPIIVFTYALWSLRKSINVAILLKRKTSAEAIIFFVGAVLNIGLNFLLVPRYGMMGAAVATIITYFVLMVILFIYNKKLMDIKYEWSRIVKITIVTALIFGVCYFISIDNLVLSVVFKILTILLFPVFLYLIKFYESKELARLNEIKELVLRKIRRREE
jgi:O-antigen/teichoic acid export membrane protein